MTTVYIGIGSNLGHKKINVQRVILEIGKFYRVLNISALYESEPQGFQSDNVFVNAVISIEVKDDPKKVLSNLKLIERRFGRKQSKKKEYTDRIIDLDILLFGNEIIESQNLVIPHPHMHERSFVLEPILDIEDPIHPVFNKRISELKEELPGNDGLIRIE